MHRSRYATAFLLLFAGCLLPLVLGWTSILNIVLPGGLPLGTLLAAIAFVTGGAVPFVISRPGSLLRWAGAAAFLAAAAWLPLGIYLSGNASLSFVNDAEDSALFWQFTEVSAALVLLIMAWSAVDTIRHRQPTTRPEDTA